MIKESKFLFSRISIIFYRKNKFDFIGLDFKFIIKLNKIYKIFAK